MIKKNPEKTDEETLVLKNRRKKWDEKQETRYVNITFCCSYTCINRIVCVYVWYDTALSTFTAAEILGPFFLDM